MEENPEVLMRQAAQIIFDKKGFNILGLNVKGVSSLTDYFLIAEGNVERHVRAMGQEIVTEFKKQGMQPIRVEGERTGDWMVIDYGDLMVHLFMPGLRQHYHLEQLWQEAKIVDLEIEVSKTSPSAS